MPTLQMIGQPRPAYAYLDPVAMVRSLWSHRELTWQFARRKIQSNYKGQALGGLWSILDPMLTLAVYTFVFGIIFQRSMGDTVGAAGATGAAEGGIARFALEVFAGMITFGIFRRTVGPSPSLIIHQRNLVKKVIYPVETLPVSHLLFGLFNFGVGALVWVVAYTIFSESHIPRPTVLLLPIVVLPVALLALGIAWILSSLGVFLRDLQSPVQSIVQMLFFMSAVFYRVEDLDGWVRTVIELNPLAQSVTAARVVMFGEGQVRWDIWALTLAGGVVLCMLGYAFFMKSRRAFADVI